jgi:hypothetical protein
VAFYTVGSRRARHHLRSTTRAIPLSTAMMFSLRLLAIAALGAVVVASETSHAATDGNSPVAPALASASASSSVQSDVSKNIIASPFLMRGGVSDLKWLGNDARTVVMLSLEGVVYLSTDEGRTWKDQNALLGMPTYVFRKLIKCKFHSTRLFIVGQGQTSLITKDAGKTWQQTHTEFELSAVSQNPTDGNLLLATAMTPKCSAQQQDADGECHKKLYVSRDWGTTWKTLAQYVVQADWLHKMGPEASALAGTHTRQATPAHAIVATIMKTRVGSQRFGSWDSEIDFVRSDDFFQTESVLVVGGNRFLMTETYIFVAQVLRSRPNEVVLRLSRDGGVTFTDAQMPFKLKQHAYTVLDTSEDQVFLHVNHHDTGVQFGHVYISDAVGSKYALSLPNNAREPNGKCDFEKVQGLEGIYIANYVDNAQEIEHWDRDRLATDDTMTDDSMIDKHLGERPEPVLHTVITFDKGGVWNYIPRPAFDAKGAPATCSKATCTLHLHGATSRWGPFYSTKSATGLIMATGNVGAQLSDHEAEVNTYLSRDGGLEWFEVKKGSRIYEFGDHGGLIVMADDTKPTDQVEYSWDEGLSWTVVKVGEELMVENIIVEPHSKSTRFLVYGMRDDAQLSNKGQGVVVALDFSNLHERQCKGHDQAGEATSDYEHWTPSDGREGDHCLLGHTTQYTRRKRDSKCYNPINHERAFITQDCKCSVLDYECDAGFTRHVNGGPCLRVTRELMNTAAVAVAEVTTAAAAGATADSEDNARSLLDDMVATHIRSAENAQDNNNDDAAAAPTRRRLGGEQSKTTGGTRGLVPAYCPHGSTYTISNGYRKVAGNTCKGGEDFMPTVYPCPSTGLFGVSSSGWFVLFVVVVLVLGMCMLTYKSKAELESQNKAFGTQDFGNAMGVVRGSWEGIKSGVWTVLGKGDDAYRKVASGDATQGWGMGLGAFGDTGGPESAELGYNYSSVGEGVEDGDEFGDLDGEDNYFDDSAVAELIPATTSARPLPMPVRTGQPSAVPVLQAPPSFGGNLFDEV